MFLDPGATNPPSMPPSIPTIVSVSALATMQVTAPFLDQLKCS